MSEPARTPDPDPGHASDHAYRLIRAQILSGERQGGDWLREGDLALSLGVSRTPVREALRRLTAEGLVRYERNRGVQVQAWTAQARPARAGSRIASAGSGMGYGYGYVTSNGDGATTVAYAPEARVALGSVPYATPVANASPSVAVWTGDDATFSLQGLRLARVNDDLAENLGRGSERGFLILDAGSRWTGLRAGDVLLEVDSHPIRDGRGARISLDASEEHTAQVIREGRERTVSVGVR